MIAVIGCGNPNRSDDGVGGEVLHLLRGLGCGDDPARVRLLDAGTAGISVMFAARSCSQIIVVDACSSGSAAGAVFEVPGEKLEVAATVSVSSHAFRWDQAIAAGRQIFKDRFPDPGDVTVFLIEAESLDYGVGLSPPVERAATIVANRIASLVQSAVCSA